MPRRRGRALAALTGVAAKSPPKEIELDLRDAWNTAEVDARLTALTSAVVKLTVLLGVRGIALVAAAVLRTQSVEVLKVRGTLQHAGVVELCVVLARCGTLQCIDLSRCGLGDEAMQVIGEALASVSCVTLMCDLSYNDISTVGFEALSRCLSASHSIISINTKGNPGNYLASSKNKARTVLRELERHLLWNYAVPIIIKINNEQRMQVVLALQHQDLPVHVIELIVNFAYPVSAHISTPAEKRTLLRELQGGEALGQYEDTCRELFLRCSEDTGVLDSIQKGAAVLSGVWGLGT